MKIFLESGHVREEPLELYAIGDLPVSSALAVERHLKDCRQCRQESLRIAEFIRILRLLAAQSASCDISEPRERSAYLSQLTDPPM